MSWGCLPIGLILISELPARTELRARREEYVKMSPEMP
jgi:hypothetical protein